MRIGFSRATWLMALSVSLFIGVMIASAGTALYPPVTAIANPLICRGEIDYQSQNYSYRPGQRGVERYIYCLSGTGKEAREDVTLRAVFWSFVLYSAISFILLRLIVVPLLRRRFRRALSAMRVRSAPSFSRGGASSAASVDVQDILARVSEALEQGRGNVVVRNMSFGPDEPGGDDDVAARLAQLRQLRENGLITSEDYDNKKAEILSRL